MIAKLRFIHDSINRVKTKGSFFQNLVYSFSGNAIAILIGLLFTPILTRIYGPEEYGLFAFFLSISQNLGNIATLQFTRAFVIPKSESTFFELLILSIISSLIISILVCILFFFWGERILYLFNADALKKFLLLVPLVVLIIASNDILRSWNVRNKEFKRGGVAKTSSTIGSRVSTLIIGLLSQGKVYGLIAGEIIARIIDNICLISKDTSPKQIKKHKITITGLNATFGVYKNYPLYMLPNSWIGSISAQLPIYFLMLGFSSEIVGHFGLANRLLNIPALLVVSSLAPVFLQRVNEEYNVSKENIPRFIDKLINRLMMVTIVPFLILMFFSVQIFENFLGKDWTLAGHLAFYLGAFYPFYIIANSIHPLFRIFGKEKLLFWYNLISTCIIASILYIGVGYNDLFLTIKLFTVVNIIAFSIQAFLLLNISGFKNYKKPILWLLLFIVSTILMVLFGNIQK